jgi:hypothetical protein
MEARDMTKRGVLMALVAVALLAAWFLFPREEEGTAARIEGRARLDLIDACNQAAAAVGMTAPFVARDIAAIRLEKTDAQSGVVALVSVFEARRDGLRCRWNGIDPATISPID